MVSRVDNSSTHFQTFSTDGTTSTSSTSRTQTQTNERSSGNVLEAFAKNLGAQQPAADQKDIFGAVFNLIGGLFNPKSQAAGQPTFDLAQLLTGALDIAENLFGKNIEDAARKTMGANPTGRSANAPDKDGYVGTGKNRVKIVPGASDGVRGIKDAGQLNIEGSTDLGGGTRASGSAKGGTFSGVTSQSGSGIDSQGNLYAQAGFAAGAGVRARAEGEIQGDWGYVKGGVGAEAQVYAHGHAMARLGMTGAEAAAAAGVGAMAGVHADTEANIGNGALRGEAKAEAKAGTGADAAANATVSYSPLEAAFSGSAGAFAGARATAEAKGTIAGVGYKVGAEAWAGVGAKVGLDAGLKDGKFSFELNVGVAVGVGAAVTIGFEIDTKDLFSVARGIIGAAGALLGGLLKPVGDAVNAVTKPIGDAAGAIAKPAGDIFGGIFGAVGGLFGGGKGDGSAASGTVDLFSSLARTASDALSKPKEEPRKDRETSTSSDADRKAPAGETRAQPLQDAPLPDTSSAYA